MRKNLFVLLASIMFSLTFLCAAPCSVCASEVTDSSEVAGSSEVTGSSEVAEYVFCNEETGYYIYLDDWANLLSETDEQLLLETMKPITAYGNVAFVSISENPQYSTQAYAKSYYQNRFGYSSGTVFLIDMEERYIYIYSDGAIYKTVTTSYANTITDNAYSYASSGDYLHCATKSYEQIYSLLEGKRIAQPMKYICNALLSIAVALLINYFLVMMLSRSRKASAAELINASLHKTDINDARANFVNQTKRYSPQSSSSSGARSGGGFSGGGGSRGGGGGGGHRF